MGWTLWGGSLPATRATPAALAEQFCDAPTNAFSVVSVESAPSISTQVEPQAGSKGSLLNPGTTRFRSDDGWGNSIADLVVPPDWMPPAEPLTAAAVYRDLVNGGAIVTIEGEDLVVTDSPTEVLARLSVLHTGVRAMVSGRRWFGYPPKTGVVAELNPALPIPAGVSVLCVEGDRRGWDRLPGSAVADYPTLFGPALRRRPAETGAKKIVKRRVVSYQDH